MKSKAKTEPPQGDVFLVSSMAALRDPLDQESMIDFDGAEAQGTNWRSRELRPEGIWCHAPRGRLTERTSTLYGSARVVSTTYGQRAEAIACGVKVIREHSAIRGGDDWLDRLDERGTVRTDRELSIRAIEAWVEGSLRDRGELSLAGITGGRWSGPKRGPTAWAIASFVSAPAHTTVHVRVNERSLDRAEESSARFMETHSGDPHDLSVFMAATADLAFRHALLFAMQNTFRKVNTKRTTYEEAGRELLTLDELYGSMGRAVVPATMWSAMNSAFALESRWMRLAQRFLVMQTIR